MPNPPKQLVSGSAGVWLCGYCAMEFISIYEVKNHFMEAHFEG